MFQNGPIRKVITKKVIFENFLIFSPAEGHPGSTFKKILEDFFKKSQVRNSHYLLYKEQFIDLNFRFSFLSIQMQWDQY